MFLRVTRDTGIPGLYEVVKGSLLFIYSLSVVCSGSCCQTSKYLLNEYNVRQKKVKPQFVAELGASLLQFLFEPHFENVLIVPLQNHS